MPHPEPSSVSQRKGAKNNDRLSLKETVHGSPAKNLRVAMLVNNPCINDSRVIREAEALARAGHEVVVLAKRAPGAPAREKRNGVTYRRFIGFADGWYPARRRTARLAVWLRADSYLPAWSGEITASILRAPNRRGQKKARNSAARAQPRAPQENSAPGGKSSQSRLQRIFVFPVRLARRLLRLSWQLFRRGVVAPAIRFLKLGRRAWRRLVLTPVIRWGKRLMGSAFVFEDIDVAMRRPLLRLRPDVIHAHDLMTLPTASRAAAEMGATLVYDSHELEMHRNATYPKLAWMRRGWLEKRHIRRADLVITVSDSIAGHLRDQYRISRPEVILNAPPLARPEHEGASVRDVLNLPSDTPLAIYVGAVTINRGLEVCVQALTYFPALHFATIGPRRKPTEEALLAVAEANGVADRLHLVDPVPPGDVVSFIRDADVSLLAIQNVCLSYYYCMPNKLFESVLAGVPVAVADLVELRRFVERYGCGFVMDETDPMDIARAIREIRRNRKAYILRGGDLEEVRANFSWPAQAARLVEAYSRLSQKYVSRTRHSRFRFRENQSIV